MEPRIQYAKTSDGVSIAYYAMGSGPLGETELRGFEDPVKLWELRWQEDD